jgi:hypothetical protein
VEVIAQVGLPSPGKVTLHAEGSLNKVRNSDRIPLKDYPPSKDSKAKTLVGSVEVYHIYRDATQRPADVHFQGQLCLEIYVTLKQDAQVHVTVGRSRVFGLRAEEKDSHDT